MLRRRVFGLFLGFLLVAVSCSKHGREPEPLFEDTTQGVQRVQNYTHLSADRLSSTLPAKIEGAESSYPTIGEIQGEKRVWLTVSKEYYLNRGVVRIILTDYGDRSEFLSLYPKFFQNARAFSDSTWVYESWDEYYRTGKLTLFLRERLGVVIEGENVPTKEFLWAVYRQLQKRIDSLFSAIH